MNVFREFRDVIVAEIAALQAAGDLPDGIVTDRVSAEPPRDADHGDIATNAAMVLAKPAKRPPRDIASDLVGRLEQHADIAKASIAGPGFINLRLSNDFWRGQVRAVLTAGTNYGDSQIGTGRKVNVEYVSANPTGPLHVGHARGTIVGDAIASVLAKAGYDVTREYYINDAGAQIETLARSAHLRYREALGEDIGDIPEGLYPGEYLKPVGAQLAARDGNKWLDAPEETWLPEISQFTVDAMMDLIRADLAMAHVKHDVFTSERSVVAADGVRGVLDVLEGRDLVYTGVLEPPKGKKPDDWEPRPQLLFKATQFGDDVDRPLRKSDDSWTYFATDMAYHLDKYRRGFPTMIDVWGADHGGYVKRMNAAVEALTEQEAELDVKICQMVKLMDGGQPAKMSKRAGTFVTLRDLVEEVGPDVVRFIMLTRRNDAPLEFDLKKVTEQSRDNPVFYVQYAHARCCSVLRHATELFASERLTDEALAQIDLTGLTDSEELALIKKMAAWPRTVEAAALAHEPHRVAYYLHELASVFHTLWTKGKDNVELRFLQPEDSDRSLARLAMVRAMATVVASGLRVMGVEPVQELHG